MNCTICGGVFMYGGMEPDRHARCREIQRQQQERDMRLDALLEMMREDIDRYLMRNI